MRYIALVAFLLCLAPVANVQAQDQKISLTTLIDQFNAVVFIHEHGATGREPKPLVKWQEPIIFSPAGRLTKKQVDHLFATVNQIRGLTGLDISLFKKGQKANLVISLLPQEEFVKRAPEGINCFGKIGVNKTYSIINGRALIPSDRPDKTDHCLVEETVQLFGVLNDSEIIKDSIFSEKSTRTSLSITDQIILRALYDPRLKVGMQQEEVQPILKQVLTEILTKAAKRRQERNENASQ